MRVLLLIPCNRVIVSSLCRWAAGESSCSYSSMVSTRSSIPRLSKRRAVSRSVGRYKSTNDNPVPNTSTTAKAIRIPVPVTVCGKNQCTPPNTTATAAAIIAPKTAERIQASAINLRLKGFNMSLILMVYFLSSSVLLNLLPLTVELDHPHGSVAKIHRLYSNTKEKSAKYLIGTILWPTPLAKKKQQPSADGCCFA